MLLSLVYEVFVLLNGWKKVFYLELLPFDLSE